MFNVRINDKKVVIIFVAIVFLGKLSSDFFTSNDTVFSAFSLLMKSLDSLAYDEICLTAG